MTTYSMQLADNTLKVDFAKTDEDKPIPADGDALVRDVQLLARQMIASGEFTGGNLLKIQGRISVVVSYTLAHEVAHLYRAIAVSDTRLGAYVVVSSTTDEYPLGSRVDFRTGEVTQVKSPSELSEPSFFIRWEGDVLRARINNAVQVDGDQIVRDAKTQLQQLIDSEQLSGGKLLKVNGRSTVLASFVMALELAHFYGAIAVFDPKIGERGLDRYVVTISHTPDLSYIQAVEKVAEWRDLGYQCVLDADIVKFFDNIDHHRLLKEVRVHIDNPGILCLIKSWISVGVLTEEGLIVPQKGIPQGVVISPILANVYLHEFDERVMATDLKLVRYADDFLVLARTQERILEAKLEIINLLESMGLMMNTEKTQITNFGSGFRFLGHGFLDNAIFPVDANEVSLKSAIDKLKGIIFGPTKGKNKRKKKALTL